MDKEEVKKNGAKSLSVVKVKALVYEGCLAADAHWKIPIKSGQRYSVDASIHYQCDSRGWSCDNWATRSGPAGVPGYYVGGSLGHPNAPIGMLIGAITQYDGGDSMDKTEADRIFRNNTLLIGERYEASSPLDGYLYLIFNDTWSWSDNKGTVKVRLTLY